MTNGVEGGVEGGDSVNDGKVAVTTDDTTFNFLASKVSAGASITLTVLNPGADEVLEISAPGATDQNFEFVVDASGFGGAFTTIQSAVDAAELTGKSEAIWVYAGTYTENVTITKTEIALHGMTLWAQDATVLIGNLTYTIAGASTNSVNELDVTGSLIVNGTAANLIWVENFDATIGGGATPLVINNTNAGAVVLGHRSRFTETDDLAPAMITQGGGFDGSDCEFRRNGATGSNNDCLELNLTGSFLARDTRIGGQADINGSGNFSLTGGDSQITTTGIADVIDNTGHTGAVFVIAASLTSLGGGRLITVPTVNFFYSRLTIGFGTVFASSDGTAFGVDGVILLNDGAATDFLNAQGAYLNVVAGLDTEIQFNNAGVLDGNSNLIFDPVTNLMTVQNLTVNGDAQVNGILTVVDQVSLSIETGFINMNTGLTVPLAQEGGLVVNYLPTSTNDTVTAGAFTAGVNAVSNPTVVTDGSAVFSANDIIQIGDTNLSENNGIYEVLSHVGTLLTVNGIGTVDTIDTFTNNQFITNASDNAVITKINVSVIDSHTDGVWHQGQGSTVPVARTDLSTLPGGVNTEVQFNNNGSFAGISGITTDGTNLDVSGRIDGDGASGLLHLRGGSGGGEARMEGGDSTNGGKVSLRGGFGTNNGGSIELIGGLGDNGSGGSITSIAGDGGQDDGSGGGGDVTLTAGAAGFDSGAGGDVNLTSGRADGFGAVSGSVRIDIGASTGGGPLGDVLIVPTRGSVGIGDFVVDNSAILEITSASRGFLMPRMTTAERDNISSPATGLEIYNITTNEPEFFNGSTWSATAGSETLAETLVNGNTSGGTDLIVSSGDTLEADRITVGAANDLLLLHDSTEGFVRNLTGDMTIDNFGTTSAIIARIGADTSAATFLVRNSSDVDLLLIDGAGDAFLKGQLALGAGDIITPGGGSAVSLRVETGSASGGNGGDIDLICGGGSGAGGNISLTSGNGDFAGGNLTLTSGAATTSGIGGLLTLLAGVGAGSSAGGQIHIFGGIGGDSSGTGGQVLINAGSGGSTDGDGGILLLEGGQGFASGNSDGGDVDIHGGQNFGSGTHGNVLLQKAGDGNVGIGTSSPSGTLDIKKTTSPATLIVDRTNGKVFSLLAGSTSNLFQFDNTGPFTIASNSPATIRNGQSTSFQAHLTVDQNGRVGIGTTIPDVSAILELESNISGFLQPRMTETQRDAIPSQNTGLSVYNTTAFAPQFFDGAQWIGFDASPDVVYVRTLADLPTPVASVISLADNTIYKFLNSFDTAGNQLKTGVNTVLQGIDESITIVSGTTTVPLVITNGADGFQAQFMTIDQQGTGDVLSISMTTPQDVTEITRCELLGGAVRLVTGFGFITTSVLFNDAPIIQDGTGGGVDSINLSGLTAIIDGSPTNGTILFEAGSTTDSFIMGDGAIILLAASAGIKVEQGATITAFNLSRDVIQIIDASAVGIEVENPDAISLGTIESSNFVVVGTSLRCEPISVSNFTSPTTTTNGIGFDGTNLIVSDATSDEIHLLIGKTPSITTTIAGPGTNPFGVVWARGNLVSSDPITNTIYHHTGFTTTISNSFAAPAANVASLTYDGTNLISIDSVTNLIYVHDGISATILKSFASPSAGFSGLTFDGVNLLVSDSNTVFVMKGISATIQYSFPASGANADDLVITDDGAAILQSTGNLVHLYDHTLTFDHTSSTWETKNNSNGLVESSDRGGSQYEDGNISITVVQNVWTDIDDGGASIFYGGFNTMEKCRLNNDQNGELIWTGIRNRGRVLSGQAVITRSGGGATDIFYELAVVINGEVQTDGKGVAVLAGNNTFTTLDTLPITRDLVATDTVKLQIRNITNAVSPEVSVNKLSIN